MRVGLRWRSTGDTGRDPLLPIRFHLDETGLQGPDQGDMADGEPGVGVPGQGQNVLAAVLAPVEPGDDAGEGLGAAPDQTYRQAWGLDRDAAGWGRRKCSPGLTEDMVSEILMHWYVVRREAGEPACPVVDALIGEAWRESLH